MPEKPQQPQQQRKRRHCSDTSGAWVVLQVAGVSRKASIEAGSAFGYYYPPPVARGP